MSEKHDVLKQTRLGSRVQCPPFGPNGEWIPTSEIGAFIECDLIGSSCSPDIYGFVAEFRSTANNPVFAALVVDEASPGGYAREWHIEHYRTWEDATAACRRAKPWVVPDEEDDDEDEFEMPHVIATYERLVHSA